MKTLYIGFRGKNNTSSQIVNQLGEDILLLTNSFSGLEKDILSITESYDSIYMFGVDSSLKGMDDALMDRLLTLFRKIPFDT